MRVCIVCVIVMILFVFIVLQIEEFSCFLFKDLILISGLVIVEEFD